MCVFLGYWVLVFDVWCFLVQICVLLAESLTVCGEGRWPTNLLFLGRLAGGERATQTVY